jgi:response regulator RpfG family c-di-GMP phosphodiesterase
VHRTTAFGKIVEVQDDVLALAREIVLTHHERWTSPNTRTAGRGHPAFGRIVALCDAWDAVSTDCVYRAKLSGGAAAIVTKSTGFEFSYAERSHAHRNVRGNFISSNLNTVFSSSLRIFSANCWS